VAVSLAVITAQATIGAGVDTLSNFEKLLGSNYNDTLTGTNTNDSIAGLGGHDKLSGFTGEDIIRGGDGNDSLYGGASGDQLFGDNHNDLIFGGDGNDSLFGGTGDDRIYGGNNNDQLYGSGGNDTLSGGAGVDHIFGGEGNDLIYSIDYGYDEVYGGAGNDTIHMTYATMASGGPGDDIYYISGQPNFGSQTIVDLEGVDYFDASEMYFPPLAEMHYGGSYFSVTYDDGTFTYTLLEIYGNAGDVLDLGDGIIYTFS